VLTLDTSGLLAALNGRDPHHSEALNVLRADGGPFLVPAGIMAEVAYMIEHRLGAAVLDAFLSDLEEGAFTPEYQGSDLHRIRALITRYRDLSLGFADATVIACAERNGGAVLMYYLRDFLVVAREGTIRVLGTS
jgi:predicted nucleic acid-binding protein